MKETAMKATAMKETAMKETDEKQKQRTTLSTRRLYIGNIPYSMDTQRLVEVFSQFGFAAERPQIIIDKETNQPKGFGFVDLATPQLAEQAVTMLDGQLIDGRTLRVAPANERSASRS